MSFAALEFQLALKKIHGSHTSTTQRFHLGYESSTISIVQFAFQRCKRHSKKLCWCNNGQQQHVLATHSQRGGGGRRRYFQLKFSSFTRKKSDLIVVLDMDECLIHSQFQSLVDEECRQQEHRPKSNNYFDRQDDDVQDDHACESFRFSLPGGDLVHVNKRPNLDHFLRKITSKYETHVFTAAMEVYASPLLDVLDPKGDMFQERYYREHCTFDPSLGVYVKDLKKALTERKGADGLNEGRVVLVDNNPMSFLANPMNGILVCNFYDDPKDDTLSALMDLLEELEKEKDVRPFLDQKFGLKDALCEAINAPIRSSWK
jgi:TFIIF-interacting CTD phosphatases, including NLI-interacting factor